MAAKAKKSVRPAASKPEREPIQIVVRRGALKRFDSLKRATANLPVTLTWDRRTSGERRSGGSEAPNERRKTERRQKPQFTWELADFVVVEPQAPADPPVSKARKKR